MLHFSQCTEVDQGGGWEPVGGWLAEVEPEEGEEGEEDGEVLEVEGEEDPSPTEAQCGSPDLESEVTLWPRATATRQMREPMSGWVDQRETPMVTGRRG